MPDNPFASLNLTATTILHSPFSGFIKTPSTQVAYDRIVRCVFEGAGHVVDVNVELSNLLWQHGDVDGWYVSLMRSPYWSTASPDTYQDFFARLNEAVVFKDCKKLDLKPLCRPKWKKPTYEGKSPQLNMMATQAIGRIAGVPVYRKVYEVA